MCFLKEFWVEIFCQGRKEEPLLRSSLGGGGAEQKNQKKQLYLLANCLGSWAEKVAFSDRARGDCYLSTEASLWGEGSRRSNILGWSWVEQKKEIVLLGHSLRGTEQSSVATALSRRAGLLHSAQRPFPHCIPVPGLVWLPNKSESLSLQSCPTVAPGITRLSNELGYLSFQSCNTHNFFRVLSTYNLFSKHKCAMTAWFL